MVKRSLSLSASTRKSKDSSKGGREKNSPSLVESVVARISREIYAGDFAAGEKLPTEQKMTQTLGVSRTVIREAMSRLQAAGLVKTCHGVGTFVLEPEQTIPGSALAEPSLVTMYDVLDMLEFRICLETQAAGLAAVKRTDKDLERSESFLQLFLRQMEEGSTAIDADMEFHKQIGRATGNRYFEDFYLFIGDNTLPRKRLEIGQYAAESKEAYLMRIHLEHQAIHDALARSDPDSARAAMRMHLVNSRERMHKLMELENCKSGGVLDGGGPSMAALAGTNSE